MKIIEKEFLRFLKDTFPDYDKKMVTVPISFKYNLGSQHGIPSKAKQIREKIAEEEKKINLSVNMRQLILIRTT